MEHTFDTLYALVLHFFSAPPCVVTAACVDVVCSMTLMSVPPTGLRTFVVFHCWRPDLSKTGSACTHQGAPLKPSSSSHRRNALPRAWVSPGHALLSQFYLYVASWYLCSHTTTISEFYIIFDCLLPEIHRIESSLRWSRVKWGKCWRNF